MIHLVCQQFHFPRNILKKNQKRIKEKETNFQKAKSTSEKSQKLVTLIKVTNTQIEMLL